MRLTVRSHRSLTAAALVALLALLIVLALPSATPAAARPAKRLVLSPRPGQVVRSNVALLRLNPGKRAKVLSARLNGKEIRGQFGSSRRGVRTLKASLSFGLRQGRNVLRVRVRPKGGAVRTAKVSFQVRRPSGLVGAGRDQTLDVDGNVQVQGSMKGNECGPLEWTVVRAPRGAHGFALTSPAGLDAGFDPHIPGTYVLRLTAGDGACGGSDEVTVKVLERSRLVPFESMAATGGDRRGIRVGVNTYLLKDAEGAGAGSGTFAQLLVLKRDTLELVANRRYGNEPKAIDDYLGKLQPGVDLAILVLQPGGSGEVDGLEAALKTIGGPGEQVPKGSGSMTLIGVPGMAPDEAKFNFIESGKPLAEMNGYLTPDQWGNYGFASSTHVPFDFVPKVVTGGANYGGFRLRHLDARTGAPAAHDDQVYVTGGIGGEGSGSEVEAARLTADLNAIPDGDVVMLEAISHRGSTEYLYPPPISGMPSKVVAGLAAAIAKVGGTRNAFNRIALKPPAVASGGLTYALVGWQGAGEGAGAEVAADVEGEGDAPELSGVLRPNNESLLRPEEGEGAPDALTQVVMKKPTEKWPLEGEPAAMRAFEWLGEHNEKLSADPRADYVSQTLKRSGWDDVANEVEKKRFGQVRVGEREFTEEDFNKARTELVTELRWVGNVREYLENLASPISDSQVLSYATVKSISARVYEEAQEPKDESTMRWLEFTQILLELGGPFTHEVSSTMASAMSLGIWLFGANNGGGEADEIPFKADELGDEIVKQMDQSVKTYKRMGDVIVTDPAKLRFVGEHGGCSSGNKNCPPGWSFTEEDKTTLIADVQRTVERESWQELLPMGFRVFKTNLQRLENPPDLREYDCGGNIHPFSNFSQTQENLAVYPMLWEVGALAPSENVWKPLVLAQPRGNYFHATTLADKTAERVFGPISASKSPRDGGLGVSLARLVPEKAWEWWQPEPPVHPTHDGCE